MQVVRATHKHLDNLKQLFDAYRVFYGQQSDLEGAERFLGERLQKNDSCIFVAIAQTQSVGFTQLYPSFSSVSMKTIWILNDLYVTPSYRQQGIAGLLMEAAEEYARQSGAIRLALSTQMSNAIAQSLYESRGYVRDQEFYHYALPLE